MPDPDRHALVARLETLHDLLEHEPASPLVSQALHQCERLQHALLQSHAEGLRFASFTLIDSQPFKQSMYRKLFHPEGSRRRWDDSWTLEGQPLDDIMQQNVEGYASWVEGLGTGEKPQGHSPEPSKS